MKIDNEATPAETASSLAAQLREFVQTEGDQHAVLAETHPQDLQALLEWGALAETTDGGARIHPAFYAGLLWAADLIANEDLGPRIMAQVSPPGSGVLFGSLQTGGRLHPGAT
jgi:hypothetical protein